LRSVERIASVVAPRLCTKEMELMRPRTLAPLAAFAVAALFVGATSLPQDSKPKAKPDVGAGRVAWFDLTTRDMKKSKEFYGKLFDWKFTGVAGAAELAVEVVSGDEAIGTIRVAEGAISSYNGVVYIQVDDMRASCKKAQELGGTIPPGFPFDLDDGRGAIALVSDPAGHPIGLYSRTSLADAKPAGK
jgi:predicted enzyme related to lactoylglutathione lyase